MARQPKYRITLRGGPLAGRSYPKFEVNIQHGFVAFALPGYDEPLYYRQSTDPTIFNYVEPEKADEDE